MEILNGQPNGSHSVQRLPMALHDDTRRSHQPQPQSHQPDRLASPRGPVTSSGSYQAAGGLHMDTRGLRSPTAKVPCRWLTLTSLPWAL